MVGWISDGSTVESSSPMVVSRGRISGGWTAGSGVRWLDRGIDPPDRILTIIYLTYNNIIQLFIIIYSQLTTLSLSLYV